MNKLKKIKIIFEDEDDQIIVQGEANDVLNAEGEIERLARFYQRMLTEDGDRLANDNEANLDQNYEPSYR